MRALALSILALSVFAALALDGCEKRVVLPGPERNADAPAVKTNNEEIAEPTAVSWGTTVIVRSADGHFYADGTVNGASQRFLIDTGASAVAFGRAEAQRLGLDVSDDDFTAAAATAAGPVKVAPVNIARIAVGSVVVTDVRGAVVDVPSLQPLLGQSFLAKLENVSIRADRMELR